MAEDGETCLHADGIVDETGDVFAHVRAFRDDGDDVFPSVGDVGLEACADGVEVVVDFRDEADLGSTGEGGGNGEVTAVAPHDFYNEGTREGGGGVADGVDGLADDVERGVDSEAVVGAGNVVIDGGWDAGEGDSEVVVELIEGTERAVAADHDEFLDAVGLDVLIGDGAVGDVEELRGT